MEAYDTDSVKYANAKRNNLAGYEITGEGEVVVEDHFLSVETLNNESSWIGIVVADGVTGIRWHADLPCLRKTERATHF